MILIFDFRCAGGHVSEHFVDGDTPSVQCPTCQQIAMRLVAAPRAKLEGITGAFPGAADKWARNRESHMARERHNKEMHGTYK